MFFLDPIEIIYWKIFSYNFGCLLQEGQPVARFGPMDDPIPKVEYYVFYDPLFIMTAFFFPFR